MYTSSSPTFFEIDWDDDATKHVPLLTADSSSGTKERIRCVLTCVDLTVWLVGLDFRWTSLRYRKLRDLKNDRKGQGLVLVWYGMIDVWGFGVIWYDWLFELCSCTIDCSNYAPVEGVSLSNPLQWGFIYPIYPVSCLWVTEWFPSTVSAKTTKKNIIQTMIFWTPICELMFVCCWLFQGWW